jgi:hypothetical protein
LPPNIGLNYERIEKDYFTPSERSYYNEQGFSHNSHFTIIIKEFIHHFYHKEKKGTIIDVINSYRNHYRFISLALHPRARILQHTDADQGNEPTQRCAD